MISRCEYCGSEDRYGHTAVCVMNEVGELKAEIRLLHGFVDFVNLWCTRENVTDEERVSVIKHHPTASDHRRTITAGERTGRVPGECHPTKD